MPGKIGIVVVGTTKTGKSTMIKYLTGENVITSSSCESTTFKCEMYSINSKLKILDTVGCEDSSGKSSSSVLQEIIQFLGPEQIKQIRIIWTIDAKQGSTPEVQKQAKWISKFGKNIWKSTIIICKQGTGPSSFKGALGSIRSNFEPLHKRLTILDLLEDGDMAKELFKTKNYRERVTFGALYTKEVKDWVLKEVNKLQVCKVDYTQRHTGSRIWYHDGKKLYENYHYGKYVWSGGQAAGSIAGNIFTLGLINLSSDYRTEAYDKYWTCCNSIYQNKIGCKTRFHKWSCCGNTEYSTGCVFLKWSCCEFGKYHPGCFYSIKS